MRTRTIRLLITIALSSGVGLATAGIIASSENGYTAGFVVLPLLLLQLVACVMLVVIGVVLLVRQNLVCLYFFLAALLLPAVSIGSALLSKEFDMGAYRAEPMRPFPPSFANKILFNRDVTPEGVQDFWRNVLSEPTRTSEPTIDGIQSIGTGYPEEGREVLVFSFFENASEDTREAVRQRILASPMVYKIIENVDTRFPASPGPTIDPGPGPFKVANMQASPLPQKY